MSFTSELQKDVAPLWEKMVTHRFVQELGDGTLPWEEFQRYFEQDYVFLRQGWIHMISLGIAKSPDFDSARVLTGFLNSVLDGEEGLFQRAFREMGLSEEDVKGLEALPTTYAFASYLTNVAYQGGFKEIITAFLCLEWTYLDWAQRLEAAGARPGNEYYQGWIDVHAGAELEGLVRWMREVLDAEPPEDEERLRGIFLDILRYEYMFWEMAYGGEEWPGE